MLLYEFPYFNKKWVETLHKNFDLIDSAVEALNQEVTSLKSRVTTAEGEIDNLQQQLAAANESINSLNQRVTELEGGGA